jgi:ABC-type glycerol-3-phosphate transport system substrate-binding protein
MALLTDSTGNIVSGLSQFATNTGAANAAVTLTIPAPGAGLSIYLTSIQIVRAATAALAGTAVLTVTTTNLPGNPVFTMGNAMVAGGTQTDVAMTYDSPIKASASATAVTFVAPVPGAAVLWRLQATYYVAS